MQKQLLIDKCFSSPQYLEEYLEDLAGVTLSLDGGVTSMNFAEAAMLIQGSVTVYSKKVCLISLFNIL